MATIHVHVGPKNIPYDKKYGFNKMEPTIEELIECYVQKHYPRGYVIAETIRMPPHNFHPYTNKKDWFEYMIFGPFKTKKDLLFILNKKESRESVKNGLVFKDGIRINPKADFVLTAEGDKNARQNQGTNQDNHGTEPKATS